MQLLVEIIICTLRKNFNYRYVSVYFKVILVIHFTVFLVSWWGRSVKRRKRPNEYEANVAQNNKKPSNMINGVVFLSCAAIYK